MYRLDIFGHKFGFSTPDKGYNGNARSSFGGFVSILIIVQIIAFVAIEFSRYAVFEGDYQVVPIAATSKNMQLQDLKPMFKLRDGSSGDLLTLEDLGNAVSFSFSSDRTTSVKACMLGFYCPDDDLTGEKI